MNLGLIKGPLVVLVATLGAIGAVEAQEFRVDLSLESAPTHIRNQSMVKFADAIRKRSNGRLEMRIFHSASKYRGSAVPLAVAQGALDMGMPLYTHISKIVPDAGMAQLPLFYGLPLAKIYALMDGPVGVGLSKKIEDKMKVKIIGRPLGIGFGSVFTTKKIIRKPSDLSQMKMRVPGGAAHLERFRAFGANPVKIPWPDLPQALQRGTIEGTLSTHESIRSAKLWDAGLKYAFDDRQTFFQYIPMMSTKKWNELPADLQQLITGAWDEVIEGLRQDMQERQAKARQINASNGIESIEASQDDLDRMRNELLKVQPKIVEAMRMDPAFVERIQAALNKLN